MNNELMLVGELAKKMGVSVRTLQYYDKEGLLKPTAFSEGGRRMYCAEDVVKLYQIISMKSLGFSLDEIRELLKESNTPERVVEALDNQKKLAQKKISELESAVVLIEGLRDEVAKMDYVDFNKYAAIVHLLKLNNEFYWVMDALDENLTQHVQQHFVEKPDTAQEILATYRDILEESLQLVKAGEPPESARSMALAKKWWDMVMEFTGGDMSLLPNLMAFNDTKVGWDSGIADKQQQVDEYIGKALDAYFKNNSIEITEME